MATHRKIDIICVVVLVLTLLLTVAFMNGEALGVQIIVDEDAERYVATDWFTANDQNADWDDAQATIITLTGDGATVRGSGAYAYDGGVVISGGGWYVLSGTLTDGSITVDANSSSKVWIRLDGVTVNCSDDACLRVDQADKVFLTLGAGTENSFTSGAQYSETALSDGTGGAIFAHDDLTINGSGSLTITAQYKHGIDANDSLVITGGTITVTAPEDGIHVNDSFHFTAADLTVNAGDDAIHSDGALCIAGGSITIPACYEGLEALTVDITGGDITIYPTDDGINANGGSSEFGFGMHWDAAAETADDSTGEAEESYIRISGGSVTIVNETGQDADGLDSNGSIYIDGGTVRISLSGNGSNNAIDYGSESGGELLITGGDVIACGGASMVEAFSAQSSQCAVLYNLSTTAAAGTAFRVLDATGSEIMSYSPACSYSSVAFSAPALTLGETYTVCVGDDSAELTLESVSTQSGSSSGFGGGMGGGMRGNGAMGGGFGGGMHQRPGSTDSTDAAQPAMPEMTEGEMPTPPDGTDGEMPAPPDGTDGEMPAMSTEDGAQRTGFARGDRTFSGDESGMRAAPAEDSAETDSASAENAADSALLLGLCAVILLAGILFAVFYKRH